MTASTQTIPRITKRWLESQDACEDQIKIFAARWPKGGKISRANLAEAATIGLDIEWLAEHILDVAALAEFDYVIAPLRGKLDRSRDVSQAAFDRDCAVVLADILGL